jgi:hypothetical protein
MLHVYTRHYPPCQHTDSNYRRCRCPKWINGTLPPGKFIRIAAKTRSWEGAERKARALETGNDPLRPANAPSKFRISCSKFRSASLLKSNGERGRIRIHKKT